MLAASHSRGVMSAGSGSPQSGSNLSRPSKSKSIPVSRPYLRIALPPIFLRDGPARCDHLDRVPDAVRVGERDQAGARSEHEKIITPRRRKNEYMLECLRDGWNRCSIPLSVFLGTAGCSKLSKNPSSQPRSCIGPSARLPLRQRQGRSVSGCRTAVSRTKCFSRGGESDV